jgi:hypothetical protein
MERTKEKGERRRRREKTTTTTKRSQIIAWNLTLH